MHLLDFCAAAPFTCFYVCLILFSFLFCLQLFTCIPARCSKIYQQDFQRFFSVIQRSFVQVELQYQFDVSTAVEIVKRFSFSLRVLLSMKFGFKKVFQKNGNVKHYGWNIRTSSQSSKFSFIFLILCLFLIFIIHQFWISEICSQVDDSIT